VKREKPDERINLRRTNQAHKKQNHKASTQTPPEEQQIQSSTAQTKLCG